MECAADAFESFHAEPKDIEEMLNPLDPYGLKRKHLQKILHNLQLLIAQTESECQVEIVPHFERLYDDCASSGDPGKNIYSDAKAESPSRPSIKVEELVRQLVRIRRSNRLQNYTGDFIDQMDSISQNEGNNHVQHHHHIAKYYENMQENNERNLRLLQQMMKSQEIWKSDVKSASQVVDYLNCNNVRSDSDQMSLKAAEHIKEAHSE